MSIQKGDPGIKSTLAYMRQFVDEYKTSPEVRELALKLVRPLPEKNWRSEADLLLRYVQRQIRYVKDVHNVETVQTPIKTLEYGQGDCDDKVTLLGALLESLGHEIRFHAMGFDKTNISHVILECKINGQWVAMETIIPTAKMGWIPPNINKSIYHGQSAMNNVKPIRKNMGFMEELSAASSLLGAGSDGGGGGAAPMSASTDTRTVINPTFQQSFNPQVSPVIQVGSGHSGGTMQSTGGGQSAAPGGMPSSALDPLAAAGMPPGFNSSPSFYDRGPTAYPPGFAPSQQGTFQSSKIPLWAYGVGAVAVGVIIWSLMPQKEKTAIKQAVKK